VNPDVYKHAYLRNQRDRPDCVNQLSLHRYISRCTCNRCDSSMHDWEWKNHTCWL